MSSPWLSTLKVRVDHLVMGAVALGLLGGGVWMWRATRSPDEHVKLEGHERSPLARSIERGKARRAGGSEDERPRFVRGYHRSAPRGEDREATIYTPPPQGDPGDLDAGEAVAAYESIVADMEAALETERPLTEREQAEFYNRASGSLTAMSAWADPENAGDRALLDDAFVQLRSLMRELNIKPPPHNPDPPLPRR